MILNHIILAMLWTVYCVLHSMLASEWIKKKLRSKMRNYKWYRLWYTLFAFVFLIAIVYFQLDLRTTELFKPGNFLFVSGIIISSAGIILMLICIRKYFMNLSGLRSLVVESFSGQLEITGIHKYLRHPLYLGTFMFIWGLLLVFPYLSLLIMDVIVTVYTLVGIELEERKLIAEFGEDYLHYRKSVPKLIPSFKSKREH
jgi:methanethiol S-methyltransferase